MKKPGRTPWLLKSLIHASSFKSLCTNHLLLRLHHPELEVPTMPAATSSRLVLELQLAAPFFFL
jgi:hypothetical protein